MVERSVTSGGGSGAPVRAPWHGTRTAVAHPDRESNACPKSKRLLDLIVAIPLLIAAAPVMLIAATLVRLTSRGPALFRQTRIGRNGRPFTLLKLRTMRLDSGDSAQRELNIRELRGEAVCDAQDGIFRLNNDPRITKIGHFLRRFSIDELPQLINVLRGQMSLVGPRPSLPWEVELYTPEQRRRHECLPGLTGLWQVSGRNRLPMPQMLALDVAYVDSRSLLIDLWILIRTPYAILFDRETR
jgi:lipopolysaccharide/colanic/teichoic acid biosynthesis glycosyltransferase